MKHSLLMASLAHTIASASAYTMKFDTRHDDGTGPLNKFMLKIDDDAVKTGGIESGVDDSAKVAKGTMIGDNDLGDSQQQMQANDNGQIGGNIDDGGAGNEDDPPAGQAQQG